MAKLNRMTWSIAAFALAALTIPSLTHAAPFDPETATQAYLGTLKGAARAKSDAYFEGGYWLLLWGALVGVATELIILATGLSAKFRDFGERLFKRPFLQRMAYVLPYIFAGALISLPWGIYTDYFREKQYGLMNQSFGGWFGEQAIGFGISLAIMLFILPLGIGFIRRSPKRWWLWGAGFASALTAVLVLVSPVYIAPLFNSYTELQPGPVRDRIVAMAKANNVPAEHIYVFDASKQTKRISANVSGLGPTIRISLNDNLLNRTTLPETAAVMGHELGHYVLGHVTRSIIAFTAIFLAAFWLASRAVPAIVARFGNKWGLRDATDMAAVPVYSLVISLAFLLMTPITNSLIRSEESEADAFGLNAAREPDGFAITAMKLSEYRKIEPGPIEEMLFFDHPSGATRVRMAMAWKAKHLAEIEAHAK